MDRKTLFPCTEEAKLDDYNAEMQGKMGGFLTYRHEQGMNFAHVLDNLIVGSCLQTADDLDRSDLDIPLANTSLAQGLHYWLLESSLIDIQSLMIRNKGSCIMQHLQNFKAVPSGQLEQARALPIYPCPWASV